MWHKAHFKKRWIYISFVINWTFGIAINAAYMIPTTRVSDSGWQQPIFSVRQNLQQRIFPKGFDLLISLLSTHHSAMHALSFVIISD